VSRESTSFINRLHSGHCNSASSDIEKEGQKEEKDVQKFFFFFFLFSFFFYEFIFKAAVVVFFFFLAVILLSLSLFLSLVQYLFNILCKPISTGLFFDG